MEFLQSRKAIWVFVAIGLIAILTAGISIWYASKYNSNGEDQVKAPEVKKTIVSTRIIRRWVPAVARSASTDSATTEQAVS